MPAVQCDQCDHCFPVPASVVGRKVQCPKCRANVRVPTAATAITHPALDRVEPIARYAWGGFTTGLILIAALLVTALIMAVIAGLSG